MYPKAVFLALVATIGICVLPPACAGRPKTNSEKEPKMTAIEITSPAFKHGETIPRRYTCDGEDVSPALSWSSVPGGTKELALICDDPDAPMGTWVHWVLFGLSPQMSGLPEALPTTGQLEGGGKQGKNDFGKIGYGGPCPPRGPAHRYFFKLYALDKTLDLKPGATKEQLLKAMEGHVLAQGELMGRYAR